MKKSEQLFIWIPELYYAVKAFGYYEDYSPSKYKIDALKKKRQRIENSYHLLSEKDRKIHFDSKLKFVDEYLSKVLPKELKKCPVYSIDCDTDEKKKYSSYSEAARDLGINSPIIRMICLGINNYKTSCSKKDGKRYRFEHI